MIEKQALGSRVHLPGHRLAFRRSKTPRCGKSRVEEDRALELQHLQDLGKGIHLTSPPRERRHLTINECLQSFFVARALATIARIIADQSAMRHESPGRSKTGCRI